MRMIGQTHATGSVKCNLLLQGWRTEYLEGQVKQIVTRWLPLPGSTLRMRQTYPSGLNLGLLPD